MITVTEHAREVLRGYERPEGTALRLDPAHDREGEELLRIDRSVSEELNGSEISVVSTLEGPSLDIKEPTGIWPLPDDS